MKRRKIWNILNISEGDSSALEAVLSLSTQKEQMLTVKVENEFYGIEIGAISEMVRYDIKSPPKTVPNVPSFIIGVINVRGEIVPVIDLRKKINLPERNYSKFDVIVVIQKDESFLGIIVDEVEDVVPVPEEKKQSEAPSYMKKLDTTFIKYLCEVKDRIVTVLNTGEIFQQVENPSQRSLHG